MILFIRWVNRSAVSLSLFFLLLPVAYSQIIIEDQNGDGEVRGLAIGDSITLGIGDGIPSGAFVEGAPLTTGLPGYPGRLEQFFEIPIVNAGIPGEVLTEDAGSRFASQILSARADYVFILEGSNDAIFLTESVDVRAALQKLVNISRILNAVPIVMTIPPTFGDRDSLRPFLQSYSAEIRELTAVNDLLLVDLETAFVQSCPSSFSCPLINAPEGLHPNTDGYDLIARVITEAITGEAITEEESS